MLKIMLPEAYVATPIPKIIHSFATTFIILPLTFIPVRRLKIIEGAYSVFYSIRHITFISITVFEEIYSMSVLLIIAPHAFILASRCMGVSPLTMTLPILPLATVQIQVFQQK